VAVVGRQLTDRVLVELPFRGLVVVDLDEGHKCNNDVPQGLRLLLLLHEPLVLDLQLVLDLLGSALHGEDLHVGLLCTCLADALDVGVDLSLDVLSAFGVVIDSVDELCESPAIPFLVLDEIVQKPVRVLIEHLTDLYLMLGALTVAGVDVHQILLVHVALHHCLLVPPGNVEKFDYIETLIL
jgi:hypothetical protein